MSRQVLRIPPGKIRCGACQAPITDGMDVPPNTYYLVDPEHWLFTCSECGFLGPHEAEGELDTTTTL